MRSSVGGADQCVGGTASGVNNVGRPPSQAFDNSTATIWHDGATGGGTTRLSYDFGAPKDIVEMLVTNASGTGLYGRNYAPAGCWVQWSDNGTTWFFGTPVVDMIGITEDAQTMLLQGVTDGPLPARASGKTIRLPDRWPAGPSYPRTTGAYFRHDVIDGGAYRIAGNVAIDGTPSVPVKRRVRLFQRLTGRLVREVWSATDGTFAFEKIALGEYLVISDDYTRLYNAVVADAVVSVP